MTFRTSSGRIMQADPTNHGRPARRVSQCESSISDACVPVLPTWSRFAAAAVAVAVVAVMAHCGGPNDAEVAAIISTSQQGEAK